MHKKINHINYISVIIKPFVAGFWLVAFILILNVTALCQSEDDKSTLSVLQSFPSVKGETSYNGENESITIHSVSGGMNYSIGQVQSPYSYLLNGMNETVDYSNGSLSLSQTDLYLPGKAGLDLTIKRIYNTKMYSADPIWKSSHEEQSGFWAGFGWNFDIGAKCIAIEYDYYDLVSYYEGYEVKEEDKKEDLIVLSMPGGGFYSFTTRKYNIDNPDKDYYIKTENGVTENEAVLEKDEDRFVLTLQSGIEYVFRKQYYKNDKRYFILVSPCAPGNYCIQVMVELTIMGYTISGYYLSEIRDKHENSISYYYNQFNDKEYIQNLDGDYNSIQTDESIEWTPIRPEKIIDSLGREIQLGYSLDNPHSEQADCSVSSQITQIAYKDSTGNLMHYQYKYNSTFGYLEEVITPNGRSTTFEYEFREESDDDDSGFLLKNIHFPTGAVSEYTYELITHNDVHDFCIAEINKNDESSVQYAYTIDEEYAMEKDGIFFKKVEVTNEYNEKTIYNFQEGKLKEAVNIKGDKVEYEYEENRIIKEIQTKNGKQFITENEYTGSSSLPIKITCYGDPATPEDDTETIIKYWYDKLLEDGQTSLDRKQKLLFKDSVYEKWIQPAGNSTSKNNYIRNAYDEQGNLLSSTLLNRKGDTDTGLTTRYDYDASGQLTRKTTPRGVVHKYEYDNSAVPVKESIYANEKHIPLKKHIIITQDWSRQRQT